MPIIVAVATIIAYSGLTSSDRELWILGMAIAVAVFLASLLIALVLRWRTPVAAAMLLHTWTPALIVIVASALSAGLILAFDVNAAGNLAEESSDTGAAGIVGGLATVAALIVESSRSFVGDHRTAWLAENMVSKLLIGHAADSLIPERNTELWNRLYGGSVDPKLWSFRGIVKTLRLVRVVVALGPLTTAPSAPAGGQQQGR